MIFTEARVRDVAPAGLRRIVYHDDRAPGLILRVSPSGVKTWLLYRRIGGRPRRVTIGRWPAVTVEAARATVHRMLGQISAGGNPAADRQQVRDETIFAELFAAYIERAKDRKRTWQEDQGKYNRYLRPWANRPLSGISHVDVVKMHAHVGISKGAKNQGGGHYAANRLVALLRCVFNFARNALGYKGENPAVGVERFREQSRDRFLRADELARFWAALNEAEQPWQDFFKLSLLTGARKSNVQSMRWAELELDRGLWRIPGELSKNGEPLIVILSPEAVVILRERYTLADESGWVFPSCRGDGHLVTSAKPWGTILKAAQVEDLRVHDLRRTLASWQAATGASLSIIGRTLGHRSLQATQVYARLDVEDVRESVETATAAILKAAQLRTLPSPAQE